MNLAAVDCLFGKAAGFKKARGPQPFVDANFIVVIVLFIFLSYLSGKAGSHSDTLFETRRKPPSGPARNKLRSFRARKTRFACCALHPCRLIFDIHVSDGLKDCAGLQPYVFLTTLILLR